MIEKLQMEKFGASQSHLLLTERERKIPYLFSAGAARSEVTAIYLKRQFNQERYLQNLSEDRGSQPLSCRPSGWDQTMILSLTRSSSSG